jgi:hypothetical protein
MRKLTLESSVLVIATLLAFGGCTPQAEGSNEESSENQAGSPADESAQLASSTSAETTAALTWVFGSNGYAPPNAIIGGWEPGRTLYICHTWYRGGLHPGKIVDNNCNIAFGGREVAQNAYEVLTGDNSQVSWVDASSGGVPPNAVSGGSEPDHADLYICRIMFNGLQPGKLVGNNCNVGYRGRQIASPYYQVLVSK